MESFAEFQEQAYPNTQEARDIGGQKIDLKISHEVRKELEEIEEGHLISLTE
jgi:hypothetical protein